MQFLSPTIPEYREVWSVCQTSYPVYVLKSFPKGCCSSPGAGECLDATCNQLHNLGCGVAVWGSVETLLTSPLEKQCEHLGLGLHHLATEDPCVGLTVPQGDMKEPILSGLHSARSSPGQNGSGSQPLCSGASFPPLLCRAAVYPWEGCIER